MTSKIFIFSEFCFLITLQIPQNIFVQSRDIHHSTIKLTNEHKDDMIVFPGEKRRHVPPACKGSSYCENVDSYPEDIINRELRINESIKYLSSVDGVDIGQRLMPNDELSLCVADEQVIYPQSAENKDNEWKFIANQKNFKQGIRIEKCRTEGASCSVISGFAAGYETSCKQKFIFRELVSISENGSVGKDFFRFPASCCCFATLTGNVLTRMGIGQQSQIKSTTAPIKNR
ncbi:protein spaetzle [Bombus terrestris]|uniref:Protein spaetzle n=1 Tax=Bombus terrestris TaxID=30195 RepID=A0A9B2JS22_BOMTE|nr:protein spaetzle [Bombus terrestris]